MNKVVGLMVALLFMVSTGAICQDDSLKGTAIKGFPFYVYTDGANKLNHFIPAGWMGDTGDLKYVGSWTVNPKSGKSCIQVKYTAEKKQSAGWSGIYWQSAANNWGTQKGGFNLSGAVSITFWARGEKGGEVAEFKNGGIAGEFPDSSSATTGPVELTKDWKQYTINVASDDLSYINGGFCMTMAADTNPDGATIYLDEIVYNGKADAKAEIKNAPVAPKTK